MTGHDLKADVIDLVSIERGLQREKIQLSDRLLHDLGMDGDDAVDFFASVERRFGTDLTHLHEHWSDHFGPEGFSAWYGLAMVAAGAVGGAVAGAAGLGTIWAVAVTITLLAAAVWGIRRWGPPDRTLPVTVGDVLRAVEAGTWPDRPPT